MATCWAGQLREGGDAWDFSAIFTVRSWYSMSSWLLGAIIIVTNGSFLIASLL